MIRPLKTTLALAALGLVALAVSVSPAVAKSKPACWQLVINDWYDGTISGKYQLHCYREALRHLPTDSKAYSSAYDDINRALQRRIAELAAAKKKHHQTPPANGNNNSAGPGASGPSNPQPPTAGGAVTPGNRSKTTKHSNSNSSSNGNSSKPQSPKAGSGPGGKSAVVPPTTRGRGQGDGAAQNLINKLGPDDATSLPIPLLVLAGLAALLMAAGGVTLVAKRAQARRVVTVPVRSANSR